MKIVAMIIMCVMALSISAPCADMTGKGVAPKVDYKQLPGFRIPEEFESNYYYAPQVYLIRYKISPEAVLTADEKVQLYRLFDAADTACMKKWHQNYSIPRTIALFKVILVNFPDTARIRDDGSHEVFISDIVDVMRTMDKDVKESLRGKSTNSRERKEAKGGHGMIFCGNRVSEENDYFKYANETAEQIRDDARKLAVSKLEKERVLAGALIDFYAYKFDEKTVMDILPKLLSDKSPRVKLEAFYAVQELAGFKLNQAGSVAVMKAMLPYVQKLEKDPDLRGDSALIQNVIKLIRDRIVDDTQPNK